MCIMTEIRIIFFLYPGYIRLVFVILAILHRRGNFQFFHVTYEFAD